MPSLDAFLQVIAGAGGTGAVLGLWLYLTLKKLAVAEAKIEALNTKVEARDATRLNDHQTALADFARAMRGELPDDDDPRDSGSRSPTGRHRRTP